MYGALFPVLCRGIQRIALAAQQIQSQGALIKICRSSLYDGRLSAIQNPDAFIKIRTATGTGLKAISKLRNMGMVPIV